MLERISRNMSLINWKVGQNTKEIKYLPLIRKEFMKISGNNDKSKFEYCLVT